MDDGAHIRLVDAHAEGVRGHHDWRLARHERALRLGAGLALHARVIGGNMLTQLAAQPLGGRIGALARAGIDDRGQRSGLGQQGRDSGLSFALARRRHHVVREVRPLEAGGDPHRVVQAEPVDDVDGHPRRRRRRGRQDRPRLQTLGDLPELVVLGAEVVAPLADAVRLVDDEQADVSLQLLADAGRPEALRRDVEHPRPRHRARGEATRRSRAPVRCALISSARPPRPSTWSCMSETSGETTSVSASVSSSAGSW